jgi:tetratricopeptide (TPR) repeat protein
LLAAIVVGLAPPAFAQTSPTVAPKSVVDPQPGVDLETIQARRQALFERMLERPDDLDAAFEYAALSVQAGDLEAAVGTLERMLIFAPGLPRLQLELGVLYFRLNAFETARSYFEAAVLAPDVPPEVREKVETYLAGIDMAGEPTRYTGQVRTGIRYQTNANRAPNVGIITLNDLPFELTPDSQGSPDGNVYGLGIFHVSHDLPSQGDTLEVDLLTYGSKQFKQDELDVAVAELTLGPAFDMRRFGIENAAAGLYGIGSVIYLDNHVYSSAAGAGVRYLWQPQPGYSLVHAMEYRYRAYYDSESSPTAEEREGSEFRAVTSGRYIITPTITLAANGYLQYSDARQDYLENTEVGFALSPSFAFDSPFGDGWQDWIISPAAGFVYRRYAGPDPAIDPNVTEWDWELFVGGELTVPLQESWALLAETEYRNYDSNYPTRDFDNFSVSLSLLKSF